MCDYDPDNATDHADMLFLSAIAVVVLLIASLSLLAAVAVKIGVIG